MPQQTRMTHNTASAWRRDVPNRLRPCTARWEPAYQNDDERQYVQEHNRIWKRNHKEA